MLRLINPTVINRLTNLRRHVVVVTDKQLVDKRVGRRETVGPKTHRAKSNSRERNHVPFES